MSEPLRRHRRLELPRNVTPTSPAHAAPALSPLAISQRRARRSGDLLAAVGAIDVTTGPEARQALVDWVREAYQDRGGGVLLGLFAQCYLGPPYVDHRMSLSGGIVEHHTAHDHVAPPFDGARPLVRSAAYLYVEVYDDGQVVPIRDDGSAVT
jgi:hypothetical protein